MVSNSIGILGVTVCGQVLLQRMKEADLFKEWESQEDQVGGAG